MGPFLMFEDEPSPPAVVVEGVRPGEVSRLDCIGSGGSPKHRGLAAPIGTTAQPVGALGQKAVMDTSLDRLLAPEA